MRIIPILVLIIFLQGCAFLDYFRNPDIPQIPPAAVVHIDKEAIQECLLLNEEVTINTFEDSIAAYGDLSTKYGICALKQSSSIKLIKKFGNLP